MKEMARSLIFIAFIVMPLMASLPVRAEILNDDEFGYIEIQDISVIENAAGLFTPVGLYFDVPRGGPAYVGDEVTIYFRGIHEKYATLIDYTPDRKVKPLVMNELTRLNDGGLAREYSATIGGATGDEYILLVISNLPLSDERIESIALAPDEVVLDDEVIAVAVNDFRVETPLNTPDRDIEQGLVPGVKPNNDILIPLSEFAIYIDYPLNTYPYNPWKYMYLYPYPRFNPWVYLNQGGPLTTRWYIFPTEYNQLQSNFWDYANTGWIDNGIWIIPPGGYWEGTLNINDPYYAYYMRILPFLARENRSYYHNMMVEINGIPIESSFDYTDSIGYGAYSTYNPFDYYNLGSLLQRGDNTIRIYWPEDQTENLELQMIDVAPQDLISEEIEQAQEDAQTELAE